MSSLPSSLLSKSSNPLSMVSSILLPPKADWQTGDRFKDDMESAAREKIPSMSKPSQETPIRESTISSGKLSSLSRLSRGWFEASDSCTLHTVTHTLDSIFLSRSTKYIYMDRKEISASSFIVCSVVCSDVGDVSGALVKFNGLSDSTVN